MKIMPGTVELELRLLMIVKMVLSILCHLEKHGLEPCSDSPARVPAVSALENIMVYYSFRVCFASATAAS